MSQNLAVGNSHQHSVSLVLSWNTSLLPPRPEAEQGRTPWLQDKAARRCMLARRGTVGSEHLHFVKAQSESGQVPVRPSVFQSALAVTWPRVILLNDRSITAYMCETLVPASRHQSSMGDGCSNQGTIHQPPIKCKSLSMMPRASVFCGCTSGSKGWSWRKGTGA